MRAHTGPPVGAARRRSAAHLVNPETTGNQNRPPAAARAARWSSPLVTSGRSSGRSVPKDVPAMPTGPENVRDAVRRLVDLLQTLLPSRPSTLAAIERCITEIVVDEM